jgi:hypothetical protein
MLARLPPVPADLGGGASNSMRADRAMAFATLPRPRDARVAVAQAA